jgi:pyruvate/2-oxoacid:ferredoxin oxidoreductase beta subunit
MRFMLELSLNQLDLEAKWHAFTVDGKQLYTGLACMQSCIQSGILLIWNLCWMNSGIQRS